MILLLLLLLLLSLLLLLLLTGIDVVAKKLAIGYSLDNCQVISRSFLSVTSPGWLWISSGLLGALSLKKNRRELQAAHLPSLNVEFKNK
jgi:hypothetical protein